MLRYLGSKEKLLPRIVELTREVLPHGGTVLDLFSGSSRVGHAYRKAGYNVWSNDISRYGATVAQTYVMATREDVRKVASEILAAGYLEPKRGYLTRTFAESSRFFSVSNAMKMDALWEKWRDREGIERSILLTALMEAADKVDATVGLQRAYLKVHNNRTQAVMNLKIPLVPEEPPGKVTQGNAVEIAQGATADLVYLDPPYNSISYQRDYHIWETISTGDEPEHYSMACKRLDVKTPASPFNAKRLFLPAMDAVLSGVKAQHVMLSFSDEGFITEAELLDCLGRHGKVIHVDRISHPRHLGGRIGGSAAGTKVNRKDSKRDLTEFLFLLRK